MVRGAKDDVSAELGSTWRVLRRLGSGGDAG